MVEFLTLDTDRILQFGAFEALAIIASSHRTKVVVEHGVIPHFLRLLTFRVNEEEIPNNGYICALCEVVEALGKIAGDGPDFRDQVNTINY